MSNNQYESPDPDDMFADTRMSFGDHIEELRWHLIQALKGFAVGMIAGFILAPYVMQIIVAPLEDQLERFEQRTLEKDIQKYHDTAGDTNPGMAPIYVKLQINLNDLEAGKKNEPVQRNELAPMMRGFERLLDSLELLPVLDKEILETNGHYVEVQAKITDPRQFSEEMLRRAGKVRKKRVSAMNITEAFMVYFKIAMMTGFVVSSPWVFYQLWAFIAAGLYPSEKKLVNVYLPFSLFLFITGVLLCQFMVMPKAIEAMLWFNEWLGIGADLRLNEWLGFALMMPLVFGVSFQTPLVMMFLHKVGIVSVQMFRDYRRISWFVMAVFAAVITPTVDAISMLFLWVPMGGLYELGILLCIYQGSQEELTEWEKEEKESNELVEV